MKSRVIFGGLLTAIVTISGVLSTPVANATPLEPDWMNGEAIVKKSDHTYSKEGCINEQRQITLNSLYYYKEEDHHAKSWCVYHYKGFDITFFKRWFSNVALDASDVFALYPREELGMAVSFGGGDLTPVENLGYSFRNYLIYSPGLDEVWASIGCASGGCQINRFTFSKDRFIASSQVTSYYEYIPKQDVLRAKDGSPIYETGISISDDGRWSAFVFPNIGLIRMDNADFSMKLIDVGSSYVYNNSAVHSEHTAITNDGSHVYSMGTYVYTSVIKYDGSCGIDIEKTDIAPGTLAYPGCQRRYLRELDVMLQNDFGYVQITSVNVDVNNDHIWVNNNDLAWYDLYPHNTQTMSQIDYLALGDSYSSGEGDIVRNGITHYLPGTNNLGDHLLGIPREICHISDRSYPFLLANDMGVSRGSGMQSVACSGAVRNDVYADEQSSSYYGQPVLQFDGTTSPRLQGLSNIGSLQNDAIQNFIPGRVRQIELLKKYKPKVATIGISGNDIGFAGIMLSCIKNLDPDGVCDYAQGDGLTNLGAAIQANYQHQVDLYDALKRASPGTDLYAVGYPQFINDSKSFCWEIGDSLGKRERTMINNAVSYFNQTIRNAAATAGIKYINIEDAISSRGGDICADSSMITDPLEKAFSESVATVVNQYNDGYADGGTTFLERLEFIQDIKNINRNVSEGVYLNALNLVTQEAFHPNALAHKAIYDYIHDHQRGSSLLNDECDGIVIVCPVRANSVAPNVPEYFGKTNVHTEFMNFVRVDDGTGQRYIQMTGLTSVKQGDLMQIIADESINNPGAMADIVIRSTPRTLGSILISERGAFSGFVKIPKDTPVGYHTIDVNGVSEAGGTKYMQTIFVTGPKGDIDGDGIKDSVDTCEFLVPSGSDSDGDGIDDSCDSSPTSGIAPLSKLGTEHSPYGEQVSRSVVATVAPAIGGWQDAHPVLIPQLSGINMEYKRRGYVGAANSSYWTMIRMPLVIAIGIILLCIYYLKKIVHSS